MSTPLKRKTATSIYQDGNGEFTVIQYHNTQVVEFNLEYTVSQVAYQWFVKYKDNNPVPFTRDSLTIDRLTGTITQ